MFYKFGSRLICFMFVLFGGVVLLHVCFHLVCCVPANAAWIYLKGSRHICVFVILTILWVMYYFGLLARLFASLFLFLGWLVGCLVGWSIGWSVWFDLICFVLFRFVCLVSYALYIILHFLLAHERCGPCKLLWPFVVCGADFIDDEVQKLDSESFQCPKMFAFEFEITSLARAVPGGPETTLSLCWGEKDLV